MTTIAPPVPPQVQLTYDDSGTQSQVGFNVEHVGDALNVAQPPLDGATGLTRGTTRRDALVRLVPALRRAALATGLLTDDELTRWSARDVARGRLIDTPSAGTVAGISARGELLVRGPDDVETAHRSGTLTFADPLACS